MPTVTPVTMEGYQVTHAGEHAAFLIEHGQHATDEGSGWLKLHVLSSYGSFSYDWRNVGPTPYQSFLAGLDQDYLMRKLMGPDAFMVDKEASLAGIDSYFDSEDAKERWTRSQVSDLKRALHEVRYMGPMASAHELVRAIESCLVEEFDSEDGVTLSETLFSLVANKYSHAADGIWQNLWPAFIDRLKADAEIEAPSWVRPRMSA